MTTPAPDPTFENEPSRPLDAALLGSLPCINCQYELQGLSIRGNCPECGLAIRATILYRVDPHADAFTPLPTPILTALGVALWPIGALVAVVFAWAPRLTDVLAELTTARVNLHTPWTAWIGASALALSAIAAVGLIKPTRTTPPIAMISAGLGILLYAPLVWCWTRILLVLDPANPPPYFQATPHPERLALKLCLGVCALGILFALRSNARRLVARSLVLRTGRVGRQTIFATAAAVGIGMTGDLVRLGATLLPEANRPLVAGLGTILVLVGSLMVTLALAGAAIDGWRIRRAILTPSPSLRQLFKSPSA